MFNNKNHIANLFTSASGSIIPAIALVVCAILSNTEKGPLTLAFLLSGYIQATAALGGQSTAYAFIHKYPGEHRNIILGCIIFYIIISVPLVFLSIYYLQFDNSYIIFFTTLPLTQLIAPYWMEESRILNIPTFALISLVRSATMIVAFFSIIEYEFRQRDVILYFSLFNLLCTSVSSYLIMSKIKDFKDISLARTHAYIIFSTPIAISIQVNLIVSYITPILGSKFISASKLNEFYIYDRCRYLFLSLEAPINLFLQRLIIKKEYRFASFIFMSAKFILFIVTATTISFLIIDNMVNLFNIRLNRTLMSLIYVSTLFGIFTSFLCNVLIIGSGLYKENAIINFIATLLFVIFCLFLVPIYGTTGLAISTVVLEFTLLVMAIFVICYKRPFSWNGI